MISHAHRTIFVHQRKSAGTSVKSLFEDAIDVCNNGIVDPWWIAHAEIVRSYYKFTVIRNPYDRFISGWKYCRSTKNRTLADVIRHPPRRFMLGAVLDPRSSMAARHACLVEWTRRRGGKTLEAVKGAFGLPVRRKMSPAHDWRHVTVMQHEYVVTHDLTLAVDRVVFFERIAEGMNDVMHDLGRPPVDMPAKRTNKDRSDYRTYFDDETRALFETKFAKELEIWKYDFDTGLPVINAASITSLDQLGASQASSRPASDGVPSSQQA